MPFSSYKFSEIWYNKCRNFSFFVLNTLHLEAVSCIKNQITGYGFILPFGGHLDENNRWVILRKSIDRKTIHEVYEKNFYNKETGDPALSTEIAFGPLYIQRKLSLTDRELVDQISENPYMQYFIGYKEYITEKPFDPRLLVTFRKRLTAEMMEEISEKMFPMEEEDNGNDDD